MSQLIIEKPTICSTVEQVHFMALKQQNDAVPCLRLYPTMGTTSFNLQIRGTLPLDTGGKRRELKPRNLVATVSVSWDDLVKIAQYVKDIEANKGVQS
jgi:hypothetical protein